MGIIFRDTGLDNLIRVLSKQDPALPARDSLYSSVRALTPRRLYASQLESIPLILDTYRVVFW